MSEKLFEEATKTIGDQMIEIARLRARVKELEAQVAAMWTTEEVAQFFERMTGAWYTNLALDQWLCKHRQPRTESDKGVTK